jgi:hypothetical protein
MTLLQKLEKTMTYGSFKEKSDLLSRLEDVFDSYNKDIEDFDSIVQSLINYAVISEDDKLISEILDNIVLAEINQDIDNISFEMIENNIDKFSDVLIARCIDILSYTQEQRYLQTILRFRNHKNKHIKLAVADALVEFGLTKELRDAQSVFPEPE